MFVFTMIKCVCVYSLDYQKVVKKKKVRTPIQMVGGDWVRERNMNLL